MPHREPHDGIARTPNRRQRHERPAGADRNTHVTTSHTIARPAPALIATPAGAPVGCRIASFAYYLPEHVITNADLAQMVDTSDEWILSRTGIRSRRRAAEGEATSDLAIAAARRALESARMDPADLDMVMVATATPDSPVPAVSCLVQAGLGAVNAAAMDLGAGCSGFLFTLHTAASFARAGAARRILVVGAETLTRVTDYSDRRSCVLFGDGAGAAVVAADSQSAHGATGLGLELLYSRLGTDGEMADLIEIPAGGSRIPASEASLRDHGHFLRLDGQRVFKQAVRRMAEAAKEAIEALGLRPADIDWLLPHQANARIVLAVAEQTGIAPARAMLDMAETGNTSAASIPITLGRARDSDQLAPGQIVMMLAFGAGLTWACQVWRLQSQAG